MNLDSILLALLREPGSGYDLGLRLRRGRHFWHAELSQIYPALRRLEGRGLLSSRSRLGARGPRRRIYELTPRGRDVLSEDIASPISVDPEKLPWLARVRFLAAGDPSRARPTLADLAGELRAVRDALRNEETRLSGDSTPDDPLDATFERAALDGALSTAEARLLWCERLLDALPAAPQERDGPAAGGSSPVSR